MAYLAQFLIVVFLFGFYSSAVLAKEYHCKYEKRFKEGGSKGAEAKLEVTNGKLTKLIVSSFNASGKEGGGYSCAIDTSGKGQVVKWSTRSQKTTLEVDKSVIEIEAVGVAYKINLEDAARDSCGFGAEWPEYVVLTPGNPKCLVKD